MTIINNEHYNLENKKEIFLSNKPFPHIQLKNFFKEEFFLKFSKTKINIDKNKGKFFASQFENKKWISKNSELPTLTAEIINELNSPLWVENLKKLSGINTLFATTAGNTELANYHEMEPGGLLAPHVDHSSDPDTGLPHVLNVIVYLSEEWNIDWGGGTDLLDAKGKKIIKTIPYIPNSAVIFLHTPYTFHGVSKISEKIDKIRKSVYVDYYSLSLSPYDHMDLDFDKSWFEHSTFFVPNNFFKILRKKNLLYTKSYFHYLINKFFK